MVCNIKTDEYFTNIILQRKLYNIIAIEVQSHNQKVNVITMYRPPSSDVNEFLAYTESLISSVKKVIIVTDSNIDLIDSGSDRNYKNFTDLLVNYGCDILNKIDPHFPKRYNSSSAMIIDQAFTSLKKYKSFLQLYDCSFSDHRMLSIKIQVSLKTLQNTYIKRSKKPKKHFFML